MDTLITWMAAIGTLGLMSFAWRDNKFYSICEHIYVASGAAHALVMGVQTVQDSALTPMMNGDLLYAVPIILGILFYARFIPGQSKWTRYPIAVVVGVGFGQNIPRLISSNFVKQISSSLGTWTVESVLVLISIMCVIMFFYFSGSDKLNSMLRVPNRFGRLVLMMAFGALFGNTVMGRLSLMIGRLSFLFRDWLGIVG